MKHLYRRSRRWHGYVARPNKGYKYHRGAGTYSSGGGNIYYKHNPYFY